MGSPLGHGARLLGLLQITLDELDQAAAALLADVRRSDPLPLPEGGRLAALVHLRVETFAALARLALEHLGHGPPALAEALRTDRDLHVLLDDGRTQMVASIWAESGDASIAPPGTVEGAVDLRELMRLLEEAYRGAAAGSGVGSRRSARP